MKNILAENMRRFRTKNLSEQTQRRGAVTVGAPEVWFEPDNPTQEEPIQQYPTNKLTDIKDGDKFNLFKDAGGVTPLYTGAIVDAMKLQDINNGKALFDLKIQGVGTKTIGWSASLGRKQKNNPNANQFLVFDNTNNASAWYNGSEQSALRNLGTVVSGDPSIKGGQLAYNDKLGKLLKAYHGQASYDPTASN